MAGLSVAGGSGYSERVKTATITEARDELSALIELVREGETVVITDEGRPVAQLVPALSTDDDEARLERLVRAGVIKRGTGRMPAIPLLNRPARSSGVLDSLIEERREGR